MNCEDIIKIIKQCRESGIEEYRQGNLFFKLKLDNAAASQPAFVTKYTEWVNPGPVTTSFTPQESGKTPVPDAKAEELVKPLPALDQMSPEEILFYHSPYYDELQAQKAAHEEKLKEEMNK